MRDPSSEAQQNKIVHHIQEPGTYRGHTGVIQGSYRGHTGVIQGTYRGHTGVIQGTYRGHAGVIISLRGRLLFEVEKQF